MNNKHLTLKRLIRSQIGKTDIAMDRTIRAKKRGKRKSPSGKIYYEYRANHSDVRPLWRL